MLQYWLTKAVMPESLVAQPACAVEHTHKTVVQMLNRNRVFINTLLHTMFATVLAAA